MRKRYGRLCLAPLPFWAGVSEGVGGVGRWQLTRLALLGRVVVHTIELDLIPLLHHKFSHPRKVLQC